AQVLAARSAPSSAGAHEQLAGVVLAVELDGVVPALHLVGEQLHPLVGADHTVDLHAMRLLVLPQRGFGLRTELPVCRSAAELLELLYVAASRALLQGFRRRVARLQLIELNLAVTGEALFELHVNGRRELAACDDRVAVLLALVQNERDFLARL